MEEQKYKGNTVVTTLNPTLQEAAYKALGAYDGAVLVMEPDTGKILAMVSKPDFNPNEIEEKWEKIISNKNSSVLLNRVTQGLYPPGSTFKIVTALEYIRQNRESYMDYTYQCDGRLQYEDTSIRCYHGTKHGVLDFTQAFAKSCNCAFADMGVMLNRNKFSATLDKLYFNKEISVGYSCKDSQVAMGVNISNHDLIQAVIGQGSSQITPLHLSMITAMIANNGEMMKPYYIDYVESSEGERVKSFIQESCGKVVRTEDANVLQSLMKAVVEEGTGTKLKGLDYSVAGKTGSAEYNSKGDSHAWFTGFTYDIEQPVVITVLVEDGGSGGEYAVPIARRILDAYYQNQSSTN